MSASLVGSEMCIRDREDSQTTNVRARANSNLQSAGRCRASRPAPIESVSYTHLTLPTICSV
eukprot:1578668-Alexandrium_andersonii.AAC.1